MRIKKENKRLKKELKVLKSKYNSVLRRRDMLSRDYSRLFEVLESKIRVRMVAIKNLDELDKRVNKFTKGLDVLDVKVGDVGARVVWIE